MTAYIASPIVMEIVQFALRLALGGVGICTLTLILACLLQRRSESLRYAVLLTGLLALLTSPAFVGVGQSAMPWLTSEPEEQAEIVKIDAELLPMFLNAPAPEPSEPSETSFSAISAFGLSASALWLLGSLVGVVRLVRGYWKQRRAIMTQAWQPVFWTPENQARLAEKVGLPTFPAVHVSPNVPMPVVLGHWRPVIVLPADTPAPWDQRKWEAVLLHEAAHIARRDPWAALAQRFAAMLFWWCPLVYVINKRLSALRETICDDFALEGSCDAIAYAELLVESAERMLNLNVSPMPVALLDSAQGGLESRVARLLEKEKKPMTKLSFTGKCLGATLLAATALLTTAATALSGGQPEPAKKVQIKIIIDGKEIDLSDANLWQHLQAAQAKPARKDSKDQPAQDKADRPKQGDKKSGHAFQFAYPPTAPVPPIPPMVYGQNNDIITTEKDGKIVITDAKTGKVIASFERGTPGFGPIVVPFQAGMVQGKSDPRIDELVKQAEAIKPGSGMAVRIALQGGPQYGTFTIPAVPVGGPRPHGDEKVIQLRNPWNWQAGKAVVIIADKDGKPRQLTEDEIKNILSGKGPFPIDPEAIKKLLPANQGAWKFEIDLEHTKKAVTRPLPSPMAKPALPSAPQRPAELDELRRQFERLNAELDALRKRVESQK